MTTEIKHLINLERKDFDVFQIEVGSAVVTLNSAQAEKLHRMLGYACRVVRPQTMDDLENLDRQHYLSAWSDS